MNISDNISHIIAKSITEAITQETKYKRCMRTAIGCSTVKEWYDKAPKDVIYAIKNGLYDKIYHDCNFNVSKTSEILDKLKYEDFLALANLYPSKEIFIKINKNIYLYLFKYKKEWIKKIYNDMGWPEFLEGGYIKTYKQILSYAANCNSLDEFIQKYPGLYSSLRHKYKVPQFKKDMGWDKNTKKDEISFDNDYSNNDNAPIKINHKDDVKEAVKEYFDNKEYRKYIGEKRVSFLQIPKKILDEIISVNNYTFQGRGRTVKDEIYQNEKYIKSLVDDICDFIISVKDYNTIDRRAYPIARYTNINLHTFVQNILKTGKDDYNMNIIRKTLTDRIEQIFVG